MSGGDQKHYVLKFPIQLKQGEPIGEVFVRRAKGKDLRAVSKAGSELDGTLMLIDRLCTLPDGGDVFLGFADELDAEDIDGLGELVMASLPSGPTTGGTV